MKIGLVQYSPEWESKKHNMNAIDQLTAGMDSEVSMLIFPEMTLTGFTMNSVDFCEEIDGSSIKYFIELSARNKTDVIAGLIEKENLEIYNSLFHFDNNGLIKARYRKIHPFSLANENDNYSSGDETVVTHYNLHRIGLSICYDLRFPELYRFYAKERTEIMINIANWPEKRISHWEQLLRARAIENQCFMVGVNRIGKDPYQSYTGCSAVYNPMGEEIFKAGSEEKVFYIDIKIDEVKEIREKLGFLNDIKLL